MSRPVAVPEDPELSDAVLDRVVVLLLGADPVQPATTLKDGGESA